MFFSAGGGCLVAGVGRRWAGIMSVPGPVGRANFQCLRRERLELETEGPA